MLAIVPLKHRIPGFCGQPGPKHLLSLCLSTVSVLGFQVYAVLLSRDYGIPPAGSLSALGGGVQHDGGGAVT